MVRVVRPGATTSGADGSTAAHQLEDGKTAVIGTGMFWRRPCWPRHGAQPGGCLRPAAAARLEKLPISVADSFTQTGALLHSSMDVIRRPASAAVDYTFLLRPD